MTRLRSAVTRRARADEPGFGTAGSAAMPRRCRIGAAVVTAVAVVTAGSANLLACPMCWGAEETSMIDATRLGILVMLGITFSVQGAFVGFFFYLRRRAKRIAEVELDTEWSELQRTSRTRAATTAAPGHRPVRPVDLRGWDPAGPQAR